MRRSIRVERSLDAPPDALFEVLADHGRYDRFDGITRAEVVKRGEADPNGLGAVRRIWIGPLRFEEEITAYEPPARLDYLILGIRGVPFRHEGGSIRLSPADGGGTDAVWTSSFEIPIPVLGRALDGVFKLRLERGFGDTLERSAELATQASPARA
jgi:uncharacterized protein YndB with AHSA1/START domain